MTRKEIKKYRELNKKLMGNKSFVIMKNTSDWDEFNKLSKKLQNDRNELGLFGSILVNEFGFARTRIPNLTEALDKLHKAICFCDSNNYKIIKDIGLNQLLTLYSECNLSLRIIDLGE